MSVDRKKRRDRQLEPESAIARAETALSKKYQLCLKDMSLDAQYRAIKKAFDAIRSADSRSLRARIYCGELLNQAKSEEAHGTFTDWVKKNFSNRADISTRTAQRYMALARAATDYVEEKQIVIPKGHSIAGALTNHDLLDLAKTPPKKVEGQTETEVQNCLLEASRQVFNSTCVGFIEKGTASDPTDAQRPADLTFNVPGEPPIDSVLVFAKPDISLAQSLSKVKKLVDADEFNGAILVIDRLPDRALLESLADCPICFFQKVPADASMAGRSGTGNRQSAIAAIFVGPAELSDAFCRSFARHGQVFVPFHKTRNSEAAEITTFEPLPDSAVELEQEGTN